MEELVAKTVEALAADREALTAALSTEKNKGLLQKVAEIIRRIADEVEGWFRGDKEKSLQAHNRQAQVFLDDVKALREMADIVSKGFDNAAENERSFGRREGAARFAKKGSSRGIYSNKSIDDYTRSQYNSYGWVVINKVLTVNELNRFYRQFADKEMLDFKYQKSYDGYYMIPTGDSSMSDSKLVFVSGTVQDTYIDRVIEVINTTDDEASYYINEVINCGGRLDFLGYFEDIARKRLFKKYTPTDYKDYGALNEERKGYNNSSASYSNEDGGRGKNSQERDGRGRFVKKQATDQGDHDSLISDSGIYDDDLLFCPDGDIQFDGYGDGIRNTIDVEKLISEQGAEQAVYTLYNATARTAERAVTATSTRNKRLLSAICSSCTPAVVDKIFKS